MLSTEPLAVLPAELVMVTAPSDLGVEARRLTSESEGPRTVTRRSGSVPAGLARCRASYAANGPSRPTKYQTVTNRPPPSPSEDSQKTPPPRVSLPTPTPTH